MTVSYDLMRHLNIIVVLIELCVFKLTDCFSLVNKQEAENCRSQILEVKGPSCPVVVVLNKTDLIRSGSVSSEPAADDDKNDGAIGGGSDNFLCQEMVESLVTCDWGHGFVSASAKNNINVVQVSASAHYHNLVDMQIGRQATSV